MNLDSEVQYSALCERNLSHLAFAPKAQAKRYYRRGWAGSITYYGCSCGVSDLRTRDRAEIGSHVRYLFAVRKKVKSKEMQLQPAINKRSESLKKSLFRSESSVLLRKLETQHTSRNDIFVGGQYLDERGEILGSDMTTQARNAFEAVKRVLAEAGATMADVVKHNVYFHCDGDDAEVDEFIDDLNRVRLDYFSPTLALQQLRYGLDSAEGALNSGGRMGRRWGRSNLAATRTLEWNKKLPLSQGWKVGDMIFVGGQRSSPPKWPCPWHR